MPVWNFVRKSFYQDSVTLMRLTRDMEAVRGVRRAAAMMGTPPNRALLREVGLLGPEGAAATPTDLVVAVLADERAAAEAARAAAEAALTTRRGRAPTVGPSPPRSRTLEAALRILPDARLALVSVPGLWAGAEAMKALRCGLHVMVFSDNVPIEDEVELKRFARSRGLFLMGPDCGTAIINGVPLGFANAVPRGRIGVAAASGTGLQAVTCHVAAAGEGISHAIGVGGRDLSQAVGGLMMEQALAALAADPETRVVCVLGKSPATAVADRLRGALERLEKPAVVHFPGAGNGAATLEDTALAAVALARGETHRAVEFTVPAAEVARLVDRCRRATGSGQRFVRGIYSGGTLAGEAIALLRATLADVAPTVSGDGPGHRVVDLGDDRFTVGRPHPMIDGAVRREWIEREGRDPETAVLLLDVVLGYGAHPDPAGEILPAIQRVRQEAEAAGRELTIVASVCGTERDPQGREAQVAALVRSGVTVMPSNAQAARLAARIAARLAGGN